MMTRIAACPISKQRISKNADDTAMGFRQLNHVGRHPQGKWTAAMVSNKCRIVNPRFPGFRQSTQEWFFSGMLLSIAGIFVILSGLEIFYFPAAEIQQQDGLWVQQKRYIRLIRNAELSPVSLHSLWLLCFNSHWRIYFRHECRLWLPHWVSR